MRNSAGEPARAVPLFHAALKRDGKRHAARRRVLSHRRAAHARHRRRAGPARLEWNRAGARRERGGNRRARARLARRRCCNNIGWESHDAGRYEEALDYWQRALAAARGGGQCRAHAHRALDRRPRTALARTQSTRRGRCSRRWPRKRSARVRPTATSTRSWPRSRSLRGDHAAAQPLGRQGVRGVAHGCEPAGHRSRAARALGAHRRRGAMNPAKRRAIFERLRAANPDPKTELDYTTPFELLVAVVLSAQATDKSVNKATAQLFPVANTPTEDRGARRRRADPVHPVDRPFQHQGEERRRALADR